MLGELGIQYDGYVERKVFSCSAQTAIEIATQELPGEVLLYLCALG